MRSIIVFWLADKSLRDSVRAKWAAVAASLLALRDSVCSFCSATTSLVAAVSSSTAFNISAEVTPRVELSFCCLSCYAPTLQKRKVKFQNMHRK